MDNEIVRVTYTLTVAAGARTTHDLSVPAGYRRLVATMCAASAAAFGSCTAHAALLDAQSAPSLGLVGGMVGGDVVLVSNLGLVDCPHAGVIRWSCLNGDGSSRNFTLAATFIRTDE